ncbi:MAG TPA: hypothetical protein VGB99_05575 [Acidobacteriota bacterium]
MAAVDPNQRYYFLTTYKTSTMQKELDAVVQQGFRVIASSHLGQQGQGLAVLLERATPPDLYSYKVLATNRSGTMQKELSAAAAEGYRFSPTRVLARKGGLGLGAAEVVLILERPPNVDQLFEYRLLGTARESTMFEEIEQAVAEGFHCVGIVAPGELMVVMEREARPPSQ